MLLKNLCTRDFLKPMISLNYKYIIACWDDYY
jgi:hypothetical protein